MAHAKNERIAGILRRIADQIERSPHEHSSSISSYGGEPLEYSANGEPLRFGPVGRALILGSKCFVGGHEVFAIEPNDN